MNPYLKSKRERYAELREAITTAQETATREGRDLTEDELRQVEDDAAQCRTVAAEIEQLTEAAQRAQQVADLSATLDRGGEQPLGHRPDPYAGFGGPPQGPAKLMPSRKQVAALMRAAGEQTALRVTTAPEAGDTQTRAVVGTTATGEPAAPLDAPEPREPRRIASAANLISQTVRGVEGVEYPVFGAGAADIATEGAMKPEYDAITQGEARPAMISVYTDYTRHSLLTAAGFEQRLRQKQAALVAKREDALLVARVLATPGIQTVTGTTPLGDRLLHAAGLVLASDIGAEPDLAIIHPDDVVTVFGDSTGTSGETPAEQLRLSLYGMQVYVSSAVTPGTALVGAWRAASRFIVGLEPTVLIDALSGLRTNTITGLTEEAVTLAVDEPSAFVTITTGTLV